jgi:hypothetical protein
VDQTENDSGEARIYFVGEALAEAQRAIRHLELKAGLLVLFETALIVVIISGLAGNALMGLIRRLMEQGVVWFAAVLVAGFVLLAIALAIHVVLTLRVLLPVPKPGSHVVLGQHQPRGLFYPTRLDAAGRLSLSVAAYQGELTEMAEDEVLAELIYEQLRLAYTGRVKDEQLNTSLLFLGGLVIGIVFFGFVLSLGAILY